MKILALDTSGKSISAAILENETVLFEMIYNLETHHSEVLLPALDWMRKKTGIDMMDFDLFACTTGPGAFTGLRIGLSTIKGLALASGKPVIGISTLEALAFNAEESSLVLCPMMDARKSQVYAAVYKKDPSGFVRNLIPDTLSDLDAWLGKISEEVLFLGDGALKYRHKIELFFSQKPCFSKPFNNQVRGAAVGLLAYQKYLTGANDDALSLTPIYLRLSEAEQKGLLPDT